MRADVMPLKKIQRLPRNPKAHDLGEIHGAIDEFGFLERIIINEVTGHMLAGHGRTETLEQKKLAGDDPPEGITVKGKDWIVPIDWVSVPDNKEEGAAVALNRLVEKGGWENDKFIGAVIFGYGACMHIASQYNRKQHQVVELVRVALTDHITPVTRIVSIALKILKRDMPGIEMVVSHADPAQGHVGGIYQAGNWIYVGLTSRTDRYMVNGKIIHNRVFNDNPKFKVTDPNVKVLRGSRKYKYLMPLTPELKAEIEKQRKPFPSVRSIVDNAPGFQSGEGGSEPTRALHTS